MRSGGRRRHGDPASWPRTSDRLRGPGPRQRRSQRSARAGSGARRPGRRRDRRPQRRRPRRHRRRRRHDGGGHVDRAPRREHHRAGSSQRAAPGRLVVVDAGPGTTDALGLAALPMGVEVDDAIEADCTDPTYARAVGRRRLRPRLSRRRRLLPTTDGALLAEPRPGLVLLGAGEALSNDQVLRADNAAVGLRLLGQSDRLVWYVPVARRPRGRRRRQRRHPAAPLAATRPVAARGRDDRPARLARPPARCARDRAAAGRGEGDRDHPQPGPALPQGRRPGARRVRAARRGPGARGRAAATRQPPGPGRPRPRRRPPHRTLRGGRRCPAGRRAPHHPPPTTT